MLVRQILPFILVFASCGCIDRMILDGTLKSTRQAASAFDTLTNLEVARTGAAASLVQIEGMQKLAPDNEDALFLLVQSWTGYAGAFIEDDWESAYDRGDEEAETRYAEQAKQAYDRAIAFGTKLLEQRKKGFVAAGKNYDSMKAYLSRLDKDDAENMLWMGAAWLSRGGVAAERPEIVADLFIGVALLERSVELQPSLSYSLATAALGAYHARAPDAELAQAKQLFERSLALSRRKALTVQVMYAQAYACNAHDEKLYRKLLEEVIAAPEHLLPEQQLENIIAKRKARRYLGEPRLKRCGFGASS
jgi:hypothetical protein